MFNKILNFNLNKILDNEVRMTSKHWVFALIFFLKSFFIIIYCYYYFSAFVDVVERNISMSRNLHKFLEINRKYLQLEIQNKTCGSFITDRSLEEIRGCLHYTGTSLFIPPSYLLIY